jgi:hypothetical protein
MHYVQFYWLVLPISFPLNVQIGHIFLGSNLKLSYTFKILMMSFLTKIPHIHQMLYLHFYFTSLIYEMFYKYWELITFVVKTYLVNVSIIDTYTTGI